MTRNLLPELSGFEAKSAGNIINEESSRKQEFVFWGGLKFTFKSKNHYMLIANAIKSKFDENTLAQEVLAMSYPLVITHKLGSHAKQPSSYPNEVLCSTLDTIRDEAIKRDYEQLSNSEFRH